jgi:glycosyltransferase involved in cell wall biosynthesis
VVAVGVPGWPSWLRSWREYTEVLAARRAARAAVRLAPKAIWERHALYSDAGWKVHAATGCRWILEVNAPLAEERGRYEVLPHPGWAARWEREVLLAAPEIVAVSRWLCRWLEGMGCRNVRHLPNGVSPHAGDRDATRTALGLGDRPVLGFLGSFKPWHGAHLLPRLLDLLPEWSGLLVGDGPTRIDHPRLIHAGHVSEPRVADLVSAMDVALAPYGADAPPWFCPLKLLAYRAQGTPIVTADLGDCAELTGRSGTVLPLGADIGAWRDAALAEAGQRYPAEVRSWADVVREGLGARITNTNRTTAPPPRPPG